MDGNYTGIRGWEPPFSPSRTGPSSYHQGMSDENDAVANSAARMARFLARDEAIPSQAVPEDGEPGDSPAGEARIGVWKLIRRLGKGGMGTVYLAEDPAGRHAALKLATFDPAAAEHRIRFLREAEILKETRHPGLVPVLEVGVHEDRLFIVFEYVPGRTLREEMARGPMDPERAVRIAAEILRALQAVHARG